MVTKAQYAAATKAVQDIGGRLIAAQVPFLFQGQAKAALARVSKQIAKAAVDAAEKGKGG
jgi:hypothetical protein